jgi:hypothetical protein
MTPATLQPASGPGGGGTPLPDEPAPRARSGPAAVDRSRYARLQAARRGDHDAFEEICGELASALTQTVRQQLLAETQETTEDAVRTLVDRVCAVAFEELAEKPADWSTYGWMSWLALREMTGRLKQTERADGGSAGRALCRTG